MNDLTHTQQQLLEESLQVLGLPGRVVNALERHCGVIRVAQLLRLTPERLTEVPNLGEKTIAQIYAQLAEHGFYRSGHGPPEHQADSNELRQRQSRGAIGS